MCDDGAPVGGDLAGMRDAVIACTKKVLKYPKYSIIMYFCLIGGELTELDDRIRDLGSCGNHRPYELTYCCMITKVNVVRSSVLYLIEWCCII
jgi:hypothetical protein